MERGCFFLKKRLDILIFEKGLVESREKAKATIMAGLVYIDGQKYDKPGETVDEDAEILVRGGGNPYVSRGGQKLEKAIEEFGIELDSKICMDVGASTGGFTDCMLQNGAEKVYAVDVGYGQLAWKLRTDQRVVNLERTNARYLTSEQVPQAIDLCSVDVSFISLKKVLPAIHDLLTDNGQALCLIKPQFEAGRESVGKKGVVRDKKVHIQVILDLMTSFYELGFSVLKLTFSPIKGPEGNIEYLVLLKKGESSQQIIDDETVRETVETAHRELTGVGAEK